LRRSRAASVVAARPHLAPHRGDRRRCRRSKTSLTHGP